MMSGHGIHVRLDKEAKCAPATIHILTDHPEHISDGNGELIASNGTIFTTPVKPPGQKRVVKYEVLASPNLDLAGKSSISTIPL